MIKTLQGHFNRGQFISVDSTEIPDNVEVYVMITDKKLKTSETNANRQLDAFNKFLSAVKSIKDEALKSEDFIELENTRANFGRVVTI
ncbi:MAG: hypothetical protein LBC71_00795 [Oscillospiraceae bacterium]|jgi:hypothetical protein|nr:hypothetical protein [Oscillospiraceae bacterium]